MLSSMGEDVGDLLKFNQLQVRYMWLFLQKWSEENSIYYPMDLYNTLFRTIAVP